MNSGTYHAAVEPVSALTNPVLQRVSPLRRALVFPLKLFWGMFFCQSLAGSVFVVGWTYRLTQRCVFKFWFMHSGSQGRLKFADFFAGQELTRPHLHWPNWFLEQNFGQALQSQSELRWPGRALRFVKPLLHSLWLNFCIGIGAIANTWALTLPAGVLWWFGWYDGWNNSFNKGYEQAAVGPLISILGIAWFIAVMFYLPLAQTRQAVTGRWRSFYEFRLIWRLARDRWVYCVLLAAAYSLLSIPLAILKTSPMFWMQKDPALSTLTNAQVLTALKGYFFWSALVVLPAFVSVRLLAGRIYAAGLMSLVSRGKISPADLAPNERELLDGLGLLSVRAEPARHVFVRFMTWAGTRVGRIAGTIVLVLVWFSFVAQIYITEFFNYHKGLGWLNQPLVQLPWFRYLPGSIRNPMADLSSALLVLLIALLVRSILVRFREQHSRTAEAKP
jgi:hypothetical protein